jgi:hypothetical protein
MKTLTTFVFLFSTAIGMSQIKDIYIGFENGIKKDFNSFETNENGYFLKPQHDLIGRRFLLGDYYYSFNTGLTTKNKWNVEVGFFTHVTASYSIFYLPEIDRGSSTKSSSPFTKWTLGLGKQLYLGKRFYYIPAIQISYLYTDFSLNEVIGGGGANDLLYNYSYAETYFSNHHFFVGLKNSFQWQFNKYLKLNAGFAYNQGIQNSYQTSHQLQFTSDADKIYRGLSISKLSHSTLFLGVQLNIWNHEEK